MLTTQFANYLSTSTDIQQWAKPIRYLWTQEDCVFPSLASKSKSFWKSFIQHNLQSHCCSWVPFTICFGQCQLSFCHIQVKFSIVIWSQQCFPILLDYHTSNTPPVHLQIATRSPSVENTWSSQPSEWAQPSSIHTFIPLCAILLHVITSTKWPIE